MHWAGDIMAPQPTQIYLTFYVAGRYTIQLQTAKKGICWPWLNPSIKNRSFCCNIKKKTANNGSMLQNCPGSGSWSLSKNIYILLLCRQWVSVSKDSLIKLRLFVCIHFCMYASLLESRCNKNYKMYFSILSTNANCSTVVIIIWKTIFPFSQNF